MPAMMPIIVPVTSKPEDNSPRDLQIEICKSLGNIVETNRCLVQLQKDWEVEDDHQNFVEGCVVGGVLIVVVLLFVAFWYVGNH